MRDNVPTKRSTRMAQKRRSYRTYTKEFKEEAVKLMLQSDRPSSEINCESFFSGINIYRCQIVIPINAFKKFVSISIRPDRIKKDVGEVAVPS